MGGRPPAPGSSCRPTTKRRTSGRWSRRSSSTFPRATVLVVDDASPDGTGRLADELAVADPRVRVRHRPAKQGLGRAYLDGFGVAIGAGASIVVQMDADFSPRPGRAAGASSRRSSRTGPISSSARATSAAVASSTGGSADGSSRAAAACSRGSSWVSARTTSPAASRPGGPRRLGGHPVRRCPRRRLRLPDRDDLPGEPSSEARIVEVPIVFRDRRVGQSKMSRRIIVEALVVVVSLRLDELRGRGPGRA